MYHANIKVKKNKTNIADIFLLGRLLANKNTNAKAMKKRKISANP
jgi:hypothetical protein